jgi:hypothetical protein
VIGNGNDQVSSNAYRMPYQDRANGVRGGVIPSRVEDRVYGPS